MKMDFHDIAKKAHGGDKEAMTLLIIEAPKGVQGDRSPEEFAEQMAGDSCACDKMKEMDYTSKEAFDPYADYADQYDAPKEESGIQHELEMMLEGWSGADPDSDAGRYYQDLKTLVESHFGSKEKEEGGEE
jgi:hypothetical protein